jgi:hypothetical protein
MTAGSPSPTRLPFVRYAVVLQRLAPPTPMIRWLPLVALVLAAACSGDVPGDTSGGATTAAATLPRGTDIWIAKLRQEGGVPTAIDEPRNVTQRPGYDNQPFFVPDGSGFWYTSIDESGEADILRYDLEAERSVRVISSAPESEYSATPLPGGGGFSAIRVEADSTQRLWRFREDGSDPQVILPAVTPVGYHAWVDESTVALFVLGAPPTLQIGDVRSGQARIVANDIGRSLQHIPGAHAISYVQRLRDGGTEIRRLDPAEDAGELIAPGVDGGDFHAWTPAGILLQARGSRIHRWSPEAGWEVIADLASLGVRLSRLAVSPAGDLIAIVAQPDEEG